MSVQVSVSGQRELEAALKNMSGKVRDELVRAVSAEADAVVQDARGHVRRDSGDLAGSITSVQDGLSAEIRPRSSASSDPPAQHAIKAYVNEHGRGGGRDDGQPYMNPAAEASRARWPKRAKEAVERGTKG